MMRVACRGGIGETHIGRNGKQDQDHPLGPKYRHTANSRSHQELACLDKVEPARGEESNDSGNVDREKNGRRGFDGSQVCRAIRQTERPSPEGNRCCPRGRLPRRSRSRGGPDGRSTLGDAHSHVPAGAEFGPTGVSHAIQACGEVALEPLDVGRQ